MIKAQLEGKENYTFLRTQAGDFRLLGKRMNKKNYIFNGKSRKKIEGAEEIKQ